MTALLRAENLHLSFGPDAALHGADFTVDAADSVAVMGPSGSGKSTLLKVLCGILVPDSGTVSLAGREVSSLGEKQRSRVRLKDFGVVFQSGELIPELTLVENVALPSMLLGASRAVAEDRALALLGRLGVDEVATAYAANASGGQVQRAAVARALAHQPRVVLADEPTGALDTISGEIVLDLLVELCQAQEAALVVVTHDHRVAAQLGRTVTVRDGRVEARVGAR